MLGKKLTLRRDPEIPRLVLRLDGEVVGAVPEDPSAVKFDGGINGVTGCVHTRPHGIGGIAFPVVPAADQHLAFLDADDPDLIRAVGFQELPHGNVPDIHRNIIHSLSKVACVNREEDASGIDVQMAGKHSGRHVHTVDSHTAIEVGVRNANAAFTLKDVHLQRRVQFLHTLIVKSECQVGGLAGRIVHQKMALHIRFLRDVVGHHSQRLLVQPDDQRAGVVVVNKPVDGARDRGNLRHQAGEVLVAFALGRGQRRVCTDTRHRVFRVVVEGVLRDTGNLAAVGKASLKAEDVHQVVGGIADHIHREGYVMDLIHRGEDFPAHLFSQLIGIGLQKWIRAEVVGQAVILRLAVIHRHLLFDVHYRQAGIMRFIVSEGAACKPVLRIDPVRDILVVRFQDDFPVAVCKHITAASLRNPRNAVTPSVDVVIGKEGENTSAVGEVIKVPRSHGELKAAGGAGQRQ